MLTKDEVALLKDFIEWQSLPFKEDVTTFTSSEQQIKAFEKWFLSSEVTDIKRRREIKTLKTLKEDVRQRNPRATYEIIAEALDAAIESLINKN